MTKVKADYIISKEFMVEDELTMSQMSKIVNEYENELDDFLFDFPGNVQINGIEWTIEKQYD